ncbi:MAG: N-acetylmuramoyl-L-alanine amidase [Armatimonadota bacterium]|nr:N-acetylmuramoyl-L-alanine amidase [Armatimonadota bacterium]
MNIVFLVAAFLLTIVVSVQSIASPSISLNYPEDGASISSKRIRIAGKATPNSKVMVNGKEMYVHSSGTFAGIVDLVPGENTLRATATLDGQTAEVVLRVTCTVPSPPDPAGVEILKESIEPSGDLEFRPGDEVVVSFRGTPGRTASFAIEGLSDNVAMVEAEGSNGWSLYKGSYRITNSDNLKGAQIKVALTDGKLTETAFASGKLSVRSSRIPEIAEVTGRRAIVRSSPDGAWDMIWPSGIVAEVTGRVGHMLRLSMPGGKEGWVYDEAVRILPAGTPIPRAAIGTVSVIPSDYGVKINLGVSQKLPFEITETVAPPTIELTIYGGYSDTDWISRQLDGMIKELQWLQPAKDVYRLRVVLNQKHLWGYDAHYEDGALVLEIKKAPKLAAPPYSPLRDLVVVLDAGHGGRESGAIGPGGLMEKEVNLDITRRLARELRKKGARVVLTRTKDVTVSLDERPLIAAAAKADILISIHNNSVPSSADPIKARGVSTYWYHPQAMELSEYIYRRALEVGVPGFGNIYSNLAIIRPHRMIAVLIEGAFMSNPDEEALLATQEFRQKLADSILKGLEDWLEKIRIEATE